MRARPRTIALVMTAMALPSFPVSFATTEIKPIRQAKVLRKRDSSSTRDQLMRLSCSHLVLLYTRPEETARGQSATLDLTFSPTLPHKPTRWFRAISGPSTAPWRELETGGIDQRFTRGTPEIYQRYTGVTPELPRTCALPAPT